MTTQQIEAWKKVRNAGTVSLIVGIISLVLSVIWLFLAILILAIAPQVTTTASTSGSLGDQTVLVIYGFVFLVVAILSIPLGIIDIVAGVKLRKPIAKPKGWIIYVVVIGALGVGSITGILMLVFGILALTGLHDIEGIEPPAITT